MTADGRPAGFHNIARDVTEQRKMQDNLKFYLRQVLRRRRRSASASPATCMMIPDSHSTAHSPAGCNYDILDNKLSNPLQAKVSEAYSLAVEILDG